MVKTFERFNSHQIYIREKYKPLWIEFLKIIVKDENLKKLKTKSRKGRISIAIMQLIYQYVMKKNPNFDIRKDISNEDTNETSD